jgi:hypothetical protein
MLKNKDFTYFTKETLMLVSAENSGVDNFMHEVSLFEAFTVIKLLKRYYGMQPSVNTSYV